MVLDTSAFVAGFDPFSVSVEQVAPPLVETEVKKNNLTTLRFNMAIESGKLKIFAPDKQFFERSKASASSAGDAFFLSDTDNEVLALALQIRHRGDKPQIVTDDYCIQNVAKRLGLDYVSLATFGIKRLITWVRYCPACHRTYPPNFKAKDCLVCGTMLKRKPKKKDAEKLTKQKPGLQKS